MRINGDTGMSYHFLWSNNVTLTASTGQTSYQVGVATSLSDLYGIIKIEGITRAIANGKLSITGVTLDGLSGSGIGPTIGGHWQGGNATQITGLTFLVSSGTVTGTFEIWGRDQP